MAFKHKNYRKASVLILMLLLMLAVSGCGSKNTEEGPTSITISSNQDDYIWTIDENKNAVITAYVGRPYVDVVMPKTFVGYVDNNGEFHNDGEEHTVIGISGWGDIESLTIQLPDTIQYIDAMTSYYYGDEFHVPTSLTRIGERAFENFGYTGQIELPSTLKEIGSYAFYNARITGMLALPDSLTELGESAFKGCSNLEGIVLPANVPYIPDGLFDGCVKVRGTLEIPEGVLSVGNYAFNGCSNLTGLSFPSSLKAIGDSAFAGLQGVQTSLVLPEGLRTIGANAFGAYRGDDGEYVCGFKGIITVPASVREIGERAFDGCIYADGLGIQNRLVDIDGLTESWKSSRTRYTAESSGRPGSHDN